MGIVVIEIYSLFDLNYFSRYVYQLYLIFERFEVNRSSPISQPTAEVHLHLNIRPSSRGLSMNLVNVTKRVFKLNA